MIPKDNLTNLETLMMAQSLTNVETEKPQDPINLEIQAQPAKTQKVLMMN